MKLVTPVIAIICSMTMFAMPLQANEGMSWYMGGIMGLTSTDVTEFDNTDVENQIIFLTSDVITSGTVNVLDADTDDSGFGFKVYGGAEINSFVGIEAFYIDLGKFSQSIDADVNLDVIANDDVIGNLTTAADLKPSGFGAAVLAKYPVSDQFSVYGKIGLSSMSVDFDAQASFSGTLDDEPFAVSQGFSDKKNTTGLMFGLGASFNVHENWRARIEWERFDVDASDSNLDINLVSGGVEYLF